MVAIKCVFNDLLTIKFNEQKKIIVNNKKIFSTFVTSSLEKYFEIYRRIC